MGDCFRTGRSQTRNMKTRNPEALAISSDTRRPVFSNMGGRNQARASRPKECRQKFLKFFPEGFYDPKYLAWERDYKVNSHRKWRQELEQESFAKLLALRKFSEIALKAVRAESSTNLLFSFEKMALRDALKSETGAKGFATGLFDWLYGSGAEEERFEKWVGQVEKLPRKQTRVLTWPMVTVFGFLAEPASQIFLKPMVTKAAAQAYGIEWNYISRPNWETYRQLLEFAKLLKKELRDLKPRDMIDIQSFIWVLGSEEYSE
ncbi:MAG: hypothetical protein JWN25_1433 [Verrucomicrobiales bacterium]|nr:hypothetical protein [Verrucomicrobiales bacterium]